MDHKKLIEAVEALERSAQSKSQVARLREIFDFVEDQLGNGMRRRAVKDIVNQMGLNFTDKSFNSALQVIRKERRLA